MTRTLHQQMLDYSEGGNEKRVWKFPKQNNRINKRHFKNVKHWNNKRNRNQNGHYATPNAINIKQEMEARGTIYCKMEYSGGGSWRSTSYSLCSKTT